MREDVKMDLKELLAGLDEDTIKTVTSTIEANATKNKAKVLISEGENQFVPQYRLDEVVAERNKQKDSNAQLSKTITELQASVKDNDGAKDLIASLQSQIAESNKVIKQTRVREAIREQLSKDDFKFEAVAPIEDIFSALNQDAIVVSETGDVTGLAEQLNNVTTSKAYMFKAKEADPNGNGGNGGQGGQQFSFGAGFALPGSQGGLGAQGEPETGSFGSLLAKSSAPKNTDKQFSYFNKD